MAKGMATTFRNFFAPKVTRQYPEERPQMPERWRGRLDLIYDPFGDHKCEVCFQCAQVCPVEAIDMSGFDSQGNRIRYGMPEIYDERKDPNAWRRAGQPARPMRNAARWDAEVDTAFVDAAIDAHDGTAGGAGGHLPRDRGALRLPARARASTRQRSDEHPLGAGLRRGRAGRVPSAARRRPPRDGLRLRRLPLRGRAGAARRGRGRARDPRRLRDTGRRLQPAARAPTWPPARSCRPCASTRSCTAR